MRALDHDYVNELVARLGTLHPEMRAAWGAMSSEQMVGHLTAAVRYSMGRGPKLPFVGSWFTRRLVWPLVSAGILRIPRNVKAPNPGGSLPTGDVETLHAVLEEYLNLVQSDEFQPARHPFFGNIGVDGWARMHVLHFEHHMKQFGL